MTPRVGDVLGFHNARLLGGAEGYKYHLCVCDREHYFLLICGDERTDDYPITPEDCQLLDFEESYLSFAVVQQHHKIPNDYDGPVRVSDDYLRGLIAHVAVSLVISPKNKRKIITGVERYLGLN